MKRIFFFEQTESGIENLLLGGNIIQGLIKIANIFDCKTKNFFDYICTTF